MARAASVNAATSAWLTPMLDAAMLRFDSDELKALTQQATMPIAESDLTLPARLLTALPMVASVRAIDWVRLGNLLRDRLGWTDYPDQPEQ